MSNEQKVSLSSFPASDMQALAYLYVQSQDLSGKTPAEIHTMYQEAYFEISKDYRQKRVSGWFDTKRGEVRQL